ncbi:WGR domain-containing protein [Rhodoferax sp.]|uniref:WGR domain-containing protein n=1 Tax=Rhodoferax sp. TaxID=50421 RepID=UPI0027678938|nr:WGR domain-containing protein [Rhodoferax sp.]
MASKKPNTKFAKTVQYFEFVDEKSSKFWEISGAECRVDVRYGKIGTTGQSQTKEFGDATAASVHANKLVLEKLAKGYSKVEASGVAVAKPPPRPVNGSAAIVDPTAQLVAAKNPQTSSAVLEMLANGDRELVLLAVAENAATSVATRTLAFQKLIDRDVYIRKVASNPLTPPSLLEVLAGHKVDEVRADVAANAATPEGALALLATDKGRYVRHSVAKNKSTPARALQALVKDVDPFVSGCAASNPSVPVEVLLKLAKSKKAHLRAGVAFNRVTPKQVLELLANDGVFTVRNWAQKALDPISALAAHAARAAVYAASEEVAPLKQKEASTSISFH